MVRVIRLALMRLCVLGSAGRGESLLAMDQDNAIIFRRGRAGVRCRSMVRSAGRHHRGYPARSWRALLQRRRHGPQSRMARVARNLECTRRRLDHALQSGRSAFSRYLLRSASACTAMRSLANELWRLLLTPPRAMLRLRNCWWKRQARLSPASQCSADSAQRAAASTSRKPGLFGIVTTARVLAIRHHLLERSTPARLSAVASLGRGGGPDLDALTRAHERLHRTYSWAAMADMRGGLPPGNKVAVKPLSRDQRAQLA